MTISWSKDLFKQKKQYLLLGALALLGIILLCIGNSTNTEPQVKTRSSAIDKISVSGQANSNDIATLEYKLADTLSRLEIGEMIPPELYEVVAEILVFVDAMDKIKSKV